MQKKWRIGLAVLIMLLCVVCDQITKSVARAKLSQHPPLLFLNGFIRVHYTENPGAFLGLGANWPWPVRFLLLTVFAGLGLALAIGYLIRAPLDPWGVVGLSLLAGGGIGNLIDRLQHEGRVTDFVRLGKGVLRTGVFNVADVAIMAGALLLMLWSVREWR
jgi:signal peptidase II